ncbi:MAG: dihydroneopterin aldolase [Bacteroidales bacterium]|nr:dihydroneopterin aldolase [Bacteroidales bacterium]
MAQIALENMEFFAYHGCFSEEQIIGTRFIVDLWIETDTTEAENLDKLSKTINYQEVFLVVKEQMAVKSKLLEHVGRRILNALRNSFPEIVSAKIKVSKMNPPLGGKIGSVSLTLTD